MDTEEKLQQTKDHWESVGVESLRDQNLKELEIARIKQAFEKYMSRMAQRLADFGCGDGYDTVEISTVAHETVGFDYSEEMLSRATSREAPRVSFRPLDLISGSISGSFSAAVSKRFLINLGDWEIQSQSLLKIADSLEDDSVFCLLECFVDGLDQLNVYRERLQLSKLTQPFHNTYLDFKTTIKYLEKSFEVLEVNDFSTYYFLTRCVSEKLTNDDPFQHDRAMREVAELDDVLAGEGIGPQKLICLKRR